MWKALRRPLSLLFFARTDICSPANGEVMEGEAGEGGGGAHSRSLPAFPELLWGSGCWDRRPLAASAALAAPRPLLCLSFPRLWDEPRLVAMCEAPAGCQHLHPAAWAVLGPVSAHFHTDRPPWSPPHHPRDREPGQDGTRTLLGARAAPVPLWGHKVLAYVCRPLPGWEMFPPRCFQGRETEAGDNVSIPSMHRQQGWQQHLRSWR